ncbi:MAG: UbiD family decarboxylase [Candidatus Thermoplasmatota archaeon]|nr:UbiD family decarboxylase [Candidatus Thermoplasmatota archaeon]MEC8257553.1 UbiD family decarboxylase [Candidatus Thermoplasmatota archaeon]
MAWKTLKRWMRHLESRGEMLKISRPVDVEYEAGAIADLLVKNNGPAVLFEQPRLADGTISKIPLVMNIFGSNDRTLRALGASHETEVGDRMVAMMKPDIGAYMRAPWKALPLVRDALAMPPRRKLRGSCQRVRLDNDLTKLPIPKTWPMDGGAFVTLPLVVTKDPKSGEHNLGMYRAQVFSETEIGLHWQIHKHGADHAAAIGEAQKMPVAICMGGPPELIFSAIAPLPDNLSEYQFAGILGSRSLRITKALTQDLMVPAEADIVIEGYCIPGETKLEGPFGDHFGFYSLTGQYPVMHVTAITARKDAVLPATIVGLPPMEDGYLGEAIGRQFSPVLQFQHRDVRSVHLPLETGFHNLAIVAAKQRYPRQARKTALGLLGAGQMMFLKVIITVDPDQNPKDLEALLDALNDKVEIANDVIVLEGMVADSLDASSPYENVHDKLIIDATTIPERDPRSDNEPLEGSFKQATPKWRQGLAESDSFAEIESVKKIAEVTDARMLRNNMLVVTTNVEGSPSPKTGSETFNDEAEAARIERISQLKNSIWQLDSKKCLRWLFITNDDMDLNCKKARRRLLWQLTSRFDVGRGLFFDEERQRLCWDATTPIPSETHGVRRWPAITLHSEETLEKVAAHPELAKYEWPVHLEFGGHD